MDNEEIQERKAHIEHLAGKLLSAAEGASHTLLIEVLITAFVAVAEKHSCCTEMAVYAALLATQHLQSTADTNAATRPDGVPLH